MPINFGEIEKSIYKTVLPPEPPSHCPESDITVTPEYTRVMNYLDDPSVRLIFVTGGAGSGKSTLIKHIVKTRRQVTPVVAPTGIAALTICGSTIHSFFKIPVINDGEIYISSVLTSVLGKKQDWSLFSRLDLIIIDEISMVRCDLLDAIDHVLRSVTKRDELFGGIKMLFVGDLFQLPPILKPKQSTANLLNAKGYQDKYFFNAKCFKEQDTEYVKLTTSFRHQDPDFMSLLNNIRQGKNLTTTLLMINRQHVPGEIGDQHLTVTARNAEADEINITKLSDIPHPEELFSAIVTGSFKYKDKTGENLPAPYHLTVKKGAMVMFTKNDISGRWVNGSIGIVTDIDRSGNIPAILVSTPPESKTTFRVTPEKWEEYGYHYDFNNENVVREDIGAYEQYPLRLAWAITIHKCQSLTLEKITIDLGGGGAFEEGQTYVALSRCKSLQGICLKRPLREADIKVSDKILQFYECLK